MDVLSVLDLLAKGALEITLENASLTDSFLENISEPLVQNRTVKKLNLGKDKLSQDTVKFLVQILEKNVVLDKVDLKDVTIDESLLDKVIAALDKNHNITEFVLPDTANDDQKDEVELILDRNGIDAKFDTSKLGAQDLDYIIKKLATNHPNLAKLLLSKPISTHAEKFFDIASKNFVLNSLELNASGLTDDHVDHVGKFLEKNSSIDSFTLAGHTFTAEGIEKVLDYLTLNNSLSDFQLEGCQDEQLDDIDDILDRNMTLKLEAKKAAKHKHKELVAKLEQTKKEEAKKQEEKAKLELEAKHKQEESKKPVDEVPKESKPQPRDEFAPMVKTGAVQKGKRKATTRNALAELEKLEEQAKSESISAKKEIPLEGTKPTVEPEKPKPSYLNTTVNTNSSPNQRYRSQTMQPKPIEKPQEVTPTWMLKVAQERDDKLLKWAQTILGFYKLEIKDLGGLNEELLWKVIEYYEPKEAESRSKTLDEIIDLFKKLDASLEISTSMTIKDIWFRYHDQFNKPQYKGIQMQRKIESQGLGSQKLEKKKFGTGPDSIYITNQDEAEAKVNELEENEGGGVDWVMFYYLDDNANKLTMKASGTGGIEEAKKSLKLNELSYTLVKTFIQRTGGGLQAKIAMITFLGGKIKPMLKASSGSHCAKLVSMCKKILFVAIDKKIDNMDDFSEKIFSDSIQVTVGKDTTPSPVIKVDGPTSTTSFTPKERSHTVIDTIKRDTVVRRMSGRVSDLMYSDHKEVAEVFGELKRGNITWIMFSYTDIKDNPYVVKIHDKGQGGVDGFKQYLKDDGIFYICSRVEQVEQISIPKVVLISFVGEKSPAFAKSLSAGHRNNLVEYARTYVSIGGQYQPITVDEITDDELVQKITGAKVNSNTPTERRESIAFVPVKKDPNFNATKNSVPDMVKANLNMEWSGKEEIKAKLDELKQGTIGWAKFNVEGKNYNEIKFVSSGKEALSDEMRRELTKDTVSYFLISMSFSEGGYGMATKYAFIEWIGGGIKPIQKSKATVVKPAVFKHVDGILKMSADFQESNVDIMTRNFIIEKITGTRIRGPEMQLEKKSDRFSSLGKDKSDVKFENLESIHSKLEEIVLDTSKMNWIMVGYKESSIDILELKGAGSGGIDEFKKLLKPDEITCIVYKLKHAKSYQKDFEHLYKYYYGLCHWTGPKITVLEKALASHHWNVFEKMVMTKLDKMGYTVQGSHYQTDNLDEINDDRLRGALRLYD